MEAWFFLVLGGAVLLVPVGSLLGLLSFRASRQHTRQLVELDRELASLRHELARLRAEPPAHQSGQQPVVPPAGSEQQAPEQAPEPGSEPASVPTPTAAPVPDAAGQATFARAIPEPVSPEPATPPAVAAESRLLAALKENWMVWLGALSVSLAGIFMVSHSISAGLIRPMQQLLLALFSGLALHGGAEFLRRRHTGSDPIFAALAGGGSITLYAALLAGVHHFGLINPVTALGSLAVVSLVTMLLALAHGPLLAVMGLSGGYLVPLLVGGEGGSGTFLLGYSFVITLSSLLLMRYVFRAWLWYATLAGALSWWLLVVVSFSSGLAVACYLATLFVVFSVLPGAPRVPVERYRWALLMLLLAWAFSITQQPYPTPLFAAWLVLLPIAVLSPMSRGSLWYLPWAAVMATFAGWMVYAGRGSPSGLLTPLQADHHSAFLVYLVFAAITTALPALWQWRQQPGRRRWASLVLVTPVIWLILGWLLIRGTTTTSVPWAIFTLLAGALYGLLGWYLERRERYRTGLAWALLAAHACYSLAVVMWLREASLTLALSVQFVTLVLLARRYQAPELYLLLKVLLAVVVARLTFNPWLQGYDASVHWSLWTYGGVTLFCAMATTMAPRKLPVRPWLEGATLHFLVLFLGAELRYWLYDGAVFAAEYSLTEAAVNTVLWGSLSIVYVIRANASENMVWLYRLLGRILLILAGVSYLVAVTVNNPWWRDGIGATPVFNLLLLAYGAPVLLALAISRFSDLAPKHWAQYVAAGGLLLFTALEIRQLWQGSTMALWHGVSEGELYSYSVVGMAYAIAAILWSTRRRSEWLHKGGMALLGVVIAKIFLIDMSGLQGLWRVAAFMGLGLALLGLAWMYRKTRNAEVPG